MIEESLLAVPLRYGSRVVGVIVVSKLGLDQFDEDDVRLLEVLAGHAAVAVENASLYESARREAESATTLLEFGRELATASSLDDIFGRVAELTAALLGSPQTSVWMADEDGLARPAQAARAFGRGARRASRSCASTSRRRSATSAPGRAVRARPRRPRSARLRPARPGASYAVAPLVVDGQSGCIVAALPDGDFGERELRLLGGLAHQARLAIANASNYEGLERTLRLDRRGARERARGERRVHLDARPVDHGPRACASAASLEPGRALR